MIRAGISQPLCVVLICLLATPSVFPQTPAPAPPPSAVPAPPPPPAPGSPLTISILEGDRAVNSVSAMTSVAVAIEVKDSNEYPVEDAAVTFTLPATGTGGTFAQGGKVFSTKSDARGQASAPIIIPQGLGKFKITVAAILNDRKGQIEVTQTNSQGPYVGPPIPPKAWYKRHIVWAAAGAAVAGLIVYVVVRKNPSATVVVTPGTPGIAP